MRTLAPTPAPSTGRCGPVQRVSFAAVHMVTAAMAVYVCKSAVTAAAPSRCCRPATGC
jgi:hypothetical protein